MSDRRKLYDLLPAVHRMRDAEQGEPLRALLDVVDEQIGVVNDDLQQLYDNWFIDTCQDWVVPYIGDLVGARRDDVPVDPISPVSAGTRDRFLFPRREIANTISFRRRKGTLAVLEELADDVAGWAARAVEFGALLAATPTVSHPHPDLAELLSVRDADELDRLEGPFEGAAHLPSVRSLSEHETTSRYAASKLGLFVFRHRSLGLRRVSAVCTRRLKTESFDRAAYQFQLNPLEIETQLYVQPVRELESTTIAGEANVTTPLRRLALTTYEAVPALINEDGNIVRPESRRAVASTTFYGRQRSLGLWEQSNSGDAQLKFIDAHDILPIDLGWLRDKNPSEARLLQLLQRLQDGPLVGDQTEENNRYRAAVDPETGYVVTYAREIRASFHYGSLGDLGGGSYARSFAPAQSTETEVIAVSQSTFGGLDDAIRDALKSDASETIVLITDDHEYTISRDLTLSAGKMLQIRAANGRRPLIRVAADHCGGGFQCTLHPSSCLVLDGLVITGNGFEVHGDSAQGNERRLEIRHCTLVPGAGGACNQTYRPSLRVDLQAGVVLIESSILGRIESYRAENGNKQPLRHPTRLAISDSIVDGRPRKSQTSVSDADLAHKAISGRNDFECLIERSTMYGELSVSMLTAQDSLFLSAIVVRRQDTGGLRFCYARPVGDDRAEEVCARYYCQPDLYKQQNASAQCREDGAHAKASIASNTFLPKPQFVLVGGIPAAYGHAAYAQLAADCPQEILEGSEDGGEMGAFNRLAISHRRRNLRDRLLEFTPVLMESEIFFAN